MDIKDIGAVIKELEKIRYPKIFKINLGTYKALVKAYTSNITSDITYTSIAGVNIVIDETLSYGIAEIVYSDFSKKVINVFKREG